MYLHHSVHIDLLIDITDSLSLGLLYFTNTVLTGYTDNNQSSNLVIDLIFLRYRSEKLDKHTIYPEWRLSLDHTPLTISTLFKDLHIHNRKQTIAKSSAEGKVFIKDLINNILSINTSILTDIKLLENAVNSFITTIERAWEKNSKIVNISKHSKSWWDMNCSRDLENQRSIRSLADWKQFKNTVKNTKHSFFDQKIQEILFKSRGPWELMNWIKKRNLSAVEAIKYNNHPCLGISNL